MKTSEFIYSHFSPVHDTKGENAFFFMFSPVSYLESVTSVKFAFVN